MDRLLEMPPLLNVGSGQHAQVTNLPQGYVYNGFLLELASDSDSLTKSDLTNIKVKLGSKTIVEADGSQLDTIQKYLGRTADAEYLAIYFVDPNAPDVVGERVGALDTLTQTYPNLSMEMDVGTATNPEITVLGMIGGEKAPEHRRKFRALLKSEQALAAAKTYSLQPDLADFASLARLHIFHSNLTRFDVKQRSVDLVDAGTIARYQYLQNELARVTQSGHFCYDRLLRDRWRNALRLWDDDGNPIPTQFKATFSGDDTIDMIAEVFADYDGI